jgi:hypothetical protein
MPTAIIARPRRASRARRPVAIPELSAEELAALFEHFAEHVEHVTLVGPFAHHRKPPRHAPSSRFAYWEARLQRKAGAP